MTTRGWAKSLLFSIFVGLFLFILCVQCVNALEPEIETTTPYPDPVSFSFGPSTQDTKSSSFRIYNRASDPNATLTGDVGEYDGNGIHVEPVHSSFEILGGGDHYAEIDLTITVYEKDPIKNERDNLCKIIINSNAGSEEVTITVTIKYNAKIAVSPPSREINFGSVRHGTTINSETPITIKEVYGYKPVNVALKISGENNWVSSSPSGTISIPAGGESEEIEFTLVAPDDPDHNRYSWTFSVSAGKAGYETITIKAYIRMPPELGRLYDEYQEIKFDKPKGTVRKYDRYIDVRVRNIGDETMDLKTIVFSELPGGRISIGIVHPPKEVPGKSSKEIKLHVTAPYDASEGTYHGRLYIDAGKAGQGYVDITIKIIWPVDFTISSSSSPYFATTPLSIDFESLELKELGYKKKRVNLTLTEVYRYKPVRNLRFSTSGEYGNWLKEEMEFSEIPPGKSRTITLKIEPGLEAVPKDYSWKYYISAYEISAKRIDVEAKIVPMNIPEMIEYLNSFRKSPLHDSYPSSEVIISNGVGMLEVVESSEIGAEDWKKIPVLMKGTLSLLSSLNDGVMSSEEENYGKAVENLVSASVSTSTIGANSELNNWDISGYAKDISTGADRTTEEVLINEARMLELRGWNIKKAVEHAMALDDISGLKKEENMLESALSYQYAATIYGLLKDKEKRIECNYEESRLMDKHDELVSDATDRRIKAEKNIMNTEENDLIRIWNTYLLLNPYKYDTFSESYGSAEKYLEDALKNYKVAGESLMAEDTEKKLNEVKRKWSYIFSMFFIACILYGAAFIYTINRVIMGTVAYMRDMYEREVGDIIVK
ncbi:MAG: hypothetical protein U9N41_07970 [Euryarchaeota archaeon]|nr:hypothetical protein [Euryarchaeota archaeon]